MVETWATREVRAATLAPLFRLPAITWVGHNAAFEVEHLVAAGIRLSSPIRCALTAAHLFSRGISPLRTNNKGSGLDLASCCGREAEHGHASRRGGGPGHGDQASRGRRTTPGALPLAAGSAPVLRSQHHVGDLKSLECCFRATGIRV